MVLPRVGGRRRRSWYTIILTERGDEDWTIERIRHHFYVDTMNKDALRQIAGLPALAQGWRDHAAKRLLTGSVEGWNRRLTGSGH